MESLKRSEKVKVAMPHYHIRWSDSKLDWEAFSTSSEAQAQAQAQAQAEQLVRQGETYFIEQLDGDCPQCSSLRSFVTAIWHQNRAQALTLKS